MYDWLGRLGRSSGFWWVLLAVVVIFGGANIVQLALTGRTFLALLAVFSTVTVSFAAVGFLVRLSRERKRLRFETNPVPSQPGNEQRPAS